MKTFNFWRENKIANHFTLTETALKEKFTSYLKTKEKDWLEYFTMNQIVPDFIGVYLKSVGNNENAWKEVRDMEALLKPIKNEYLDYLTYCEAKKEINEIPLTFEQYKELNEIGANVKH